ncbi:class I SAM-dependent methyltransferase [Planktothrix agardhii 1029]|uniref:class I SAM-dependent methyltransferase n=1 Tax=Planktothrix agardhii TaxID=1160 RepID=UPI001F37DAF2|nr:class I SAM-dependent methyltransferase [Planktothrix agardhii]MCF3591020.1 class I SAM-dependent methyltransferase [Planktothrix agardhii 1029]MCF3619515.1 class I SAM-dependent methyltransferase [Planktothrix agardhii 1030]
MKLSITLPSLHKNLVESTINRIYSTTENIDYEIIVVSPFKISGPNIKWVPETEPSGNCGAHAAAWEASEGDIIVAMCDDFVPESGCFESVVSFLIEREKSYFPYACGLNWNIGKIGTVFGYYYPYIPALSRKSIEKIAGYYLRDYISDYGDCDIGMRIWDANGRCELCEAAKIDSIGDRLGIPNILANRGISLQKGAEIFEEKWQEKYGKGWGSQYNVNLPFSVLREHTFYKASSLTVKVLTTLKDSDYIIKQLNEPSQLFPQEIILNKPSEILSSGILHHQANLLNIKGHSLGKSDCMVLESLMKKIAKNKMKVVEIGSWKGMGTAVIGGVLSDYKGTLFAIDNWKGSSDVPSMEKEARETDILNLFIKNMRVLGLFDSVVKPMAMDSIVASQIFQDNALDLVFIDGEHSYSSVKQDISTWLPKLKEGGTICGHCGDGYYSQYPEIVKAEIDRQCEVDYIRIEGVGVHPGVVKALYDIFADRYKIMPDSTLWYYQKTMDSQWSATRSKLKTSNAYYAAHVKILLNILGETTKKEHLDLSFPSQGDIHQSERISRVAQYCTQGWIGDLIQLGFKGIETTKKLAALAITSNRRLMIVPLDEAETQYISSITKDIEPYKDVVDIISSCSLTPETIELIKNKQLCFAFIDCLDTYDICLTAIKTVAHCSGVLAIDNILQNSEISRAFLQGSELTHRSKLYLPDYQEAYLLWPLA